MPSGASLAPAADVGGGDTAESFVVAAVRFSHGGLLAVVRRCVGCDRCVCFARSMSRCEGMPEPRLHRTAAATDGGGAARRGAGVEPEGCPFGATL